MAWPTGRWSRWSGYPAAAARCPPSLPTTPRLELHGQLAGLLLLVHEGSWNPLIPQEQEVLDVPNWVWGGSACSRPGVNGLWKQAHHTPCIFRAFSSVMLEGRWAEKWREEEKTANKSRQPTPMPTTPRMWSKALAKEGWAQHSISALQPFMEIERGTRAWVTAQNATCGAKSVGFWQTGASHPL